MAMMRKRKDDVIFSYPIATTRAHGKTVRGEVLGSAEGTPAFWDPPTTTLFSSLRGYLVATHEVKGEAILRLGWQPEGATALRSVTSADVTHDGHPSGRLGSCKLPRQHWRFQTAALT